MIEQVQKALTTPPDSRDKIAAWVKYFLEFDVHQTVRCVAKDCEDQHTCQLDYISEAFLCQYSSCVFMASRYGGKSYAAAIVDIMDAWFNPGIKIAVAAFLRDQSDYIYHYICDFLKVFEQRIGVKPGGVAKITKDDITFKNRSLISFYSGGSKASVKGWHGARLQIDECDLFKLEQFDGIANSLSADGQFPTRLDVLSTNYHVAGDGVVLRQIEKYKQFNKTRNPHLRPCRVFKTCLLDVMERCDDRFKCFDESTKQHCPLWTYCKGVAKEGDGFYTIPRVFETMRDSSRQTFESQMLLLRPSSEFAYFHNFDIAKNVNDPDVEMDRAASTIPFVIFDFGGVHCPHAAIIAQKTKEGIYTALDEFTAMGQLEGLAAKVLAKYPDATDYDCFADPKGGDTPQVKGGVSYTGTLKKLGFFPRTKNLKREPTFQLTFNLIEPAAGPVRLKINKRCKQLLQQIYAAECKVTKSGKVTTEPADYGKDDLLDCLRYCIGWTSGSYAKWGGSKTPPRWFAL